MSDSGYTLVETLVALAILGMAVAGLTMSAQVLGRFQLRIEAAVRDERARQAAASSLQALLDRQGPFPSYATNQFSGTAEGFTFACGGAAPCEVEIERGAKAFGLRLSDRSGRMRSIEVDRAGHPRFRYLSDRGEGDRWPPTAPATQTLRAVVLAVDDASPPMAPIVSRLWVEQSPRCVFDAITQDCR